MSKFRDGAWTTQRYKNVYKSPKNVPISEARFSSRKSTKKSKLINKRPCITISFKNKSFNALIDSGAQCSVISKSVYERLPKVLVKKTEPCAFDLVSASNDAIKTSNFTATIKFKIEDVSFRYMCMCWGSYQSLATHGGRT